MFNTNLFNKNLRIAIGGNHPNLRKYIIIPHNLVGFSLRLVRNWKRWIRKSIKNLFPAILIMCSPHSLLKVRRERVIRKKKSFPRISRNARNISWLVISTQIHFKWTYIYLGCHIDHPRMEDTFSFALLSDHHSEPKRRLK